MKQKFIQRVIETHYYVLGHIDPEGNAIIVAEVNAVYGLTIKQMQELKNIYPGEAVLKHYVKKERYSIPIQMYVDACKAYAKSQQGE